MTTAVVDAGARGSRVARAGLLFAAFACAACGLVYELALITLGSYLLGDSVTQASVVLGVMVFSMGVGALLAKRIRTMPALGFAIIESLLAVVGGLSVLLLYAAFAWLDLYQPALIVISFVIGALIGAEIPLLVRLLQSVREEEAADSVADLFAADYVGALLGGLAFPFVLLPRFGHLDGAIVVGLFNVFAAALVAMWLFRRSLSVRGVVAAVVSLGAALLILGLAALVSGRFEVSARQALYDDPIVTSLRSSYQDIVLTESIALSGTKDVRLFLNGDLQFSSRDEYRYHEALVHPAMDGPRDRALVLGGGDALAIRELLRYDDVGSVVNVELDPDVTRVARTDPRLRSLNADALADPRVSVLHQDAFVWARENREKFDVVIADFPDPDSAATAKLYSVEFYGLLARALRPGGRLVVQGGSPYFAADAFWCVEATLRAAGFATVPYWADVPSFGNWGFVLATRESPSRPQLAVAPDGPPLRYMSDQVLEAATVFPPDRAQRDVAPSTLLSPRVLDYSRRGWQDY